MAGFTDAVGNISRGAQIFNKDPFLVGANAFVPLNSQLQYEKNLMGVWADADTQQGKINATNALNAFKTTEANIGQQKLLGSDEAIRNQSLFLQNPDGTFRLIEDASADALKNSANPYARAALYQAGQQGARTTAQTEAYLNPEANVDNQQRFGTVNRGISVEPTGDGNYRVTNGVQTLGVFSPGELGLVLSGQQTRVGAAQVARDDFDHRAATQFDYNTKLNDQKNRWNAEIARAGAEGKAAAAQINANVKGLESFQKFVTDNGLIQAAASGDENATRQLVSFAQYTEQVYGMAPGTLTSAFLAEAPDATIKDNTSAVGAAFKTGGQPQQHTNQSVNYFGLNPSAGYLTP
nr:MAG TPA: hypothetical protein [Bacteriophage sp.]